MAKAQIILGELGGGTGLLDEDVLFLLNSDNTALTNGWTINNGDWSSSGTGIEISCAGGTMKTAYTNNKLNLRGYSKLVVLATSGNPIYGSTEIAVFGAQPPDSAADRTLASYSDCLGVTSFTSSNAAPTIDITNIDEGYIVLGTGRSNGNALSKYYSTVLVK